MSKILSTWFVHSPLDVDVAAFLYTSSYVESILVPKQRRCKDLWSIINIFADIDTMIKSILK